MNSGVYFVSLGCDKNLVDSEVMLGLIGEAGLDIVYEPQAADIIIVNTCCFIKDALMESIETIIEMAGYKTEGKCRGLIVTGCLAERYEKEIFDEIPEVDAILGVTAYDAIAQAIKRLLSGEKKLEYFCDINLPADGKTSLKRAVSSAGYYSYLKIAEGCDNHCTYCIIPKIRGKYRSRDIESLVCEAEKLAEAGTKELILVAQDTAYYGTDIYGEPSLPRLLRELAKIDGIEWLRILYCYPEHITDELIEVMAAEKKVCRYIDMPIQHASDSVLKRMGRKSTKAVISGVTDRLRGKMPDISIRTTVITGFPAETEEEFGELLAFIEEKRFDKLGAFAFSKEDGTAAAKLKGQHKESVKKERRDMVMRTQQRISGEKIKEKTGKVLRCIVDGRLSGESVYCGRSYSDAPEIDGMVFFESERELMSGDFVDIRITGTSEYDLYGEEADK